MEAFGIFGVIFGMAAFARVIQLEKKLKETGILNKNFKSDKKNNVYG